MSREIVIEAVAIRRLQFVHGGFSLYTSSLLTKNAKIVQNA